MIDKNDDLITFPNVNHEKMMNTNVSISIYSTYHYYNDNNSKNSNIYNYYYYCDFDLDRNDLLHTKSIDNCFIHNDNIIVVFMIKSAIIMLIVIINNNNNNYNRVMISFRMNYQYIYECIIMIIQ